MTIRSLFTPPEKLFAEWMLHHEFNQVIEAEPCFPRCDQDAVMRNYYRIPQESTPITYPSSKESEKLRKMRLIHLKLPLEDERESARKKKLGLSGHSITLAFEDVTKQVKPVRTKETIDQIVSHHCPEIQKVEKKAFAELVKYGDFWGRTHFTATEKQTDYFLVDGWLVASIPKEKKDNPYEINDEVDITVAFKYDEGPDPIANMIAQYMILWFADQAVKLLIVLTTSFAMAAMFVVTSLALGKTGHLAEQLLSRAFLIGSIALQAIFFYSAIKLYQLHCFTDKMKSINNLGSWVWQIRQTACAYPALFVENFDRISKFFTEAELISYVMQDPSIGHEIIQELLKDINSPNSLSQVKV